MKTWRDLRAGRDESDLPGRLGLRLGLRLVTAVWLRRGASRERGLSIPGPHSLGRSLGGPAVRCEKTSNGGLEVGRALVCRALAAPTVMPLALTCAHLPTILLESKNENRKIEEEEAKSTPFQPSPEMSWCPDIFFLFPNVKTKTTHPCFLPHELLCNPLVPSSGKRLVTYTLQKEFAEVLGTLYEHSVLLCVPV